MIDLKIESTIPGEKINEAKEVVATITGPREDVLLFVELSFMAQGEQADIQSVKKDGEEVYADRTQRTEE